MPLKQVILIRTDLKMGRGKEISQGAHASMKGVVENWEDPRVRDWLSGPFTKTVCAVPDGEAMLEIVDRARAKGLIAVSIVDSGQTAFDNVPTLTAAAIGPARYEDFASLTDHLKLR